MNGLSKSLATEKSINSSLQGIVGLLADSSEQAAASAFLLLYI